MKYFIPLAVVTACTVLVGPSFGYIYKIFTSQDQISGFSSQIVFTGVIFLVTYGSLILVLYGLGFPNPEFRWITRTWGFVIIGLLLPYLLSVN